MVLWIKMSTLVSVEICFLYNGQTICPSSLKLAAVFGIIFFMTGIFSVYLTALTAF